jgi:hypothetical protein
MGIGTPKKYKTTKAIDMTAMGLLRNNPIMVSFAPRFHMLEG